MALSISRSIGRGVRHALSRSGVAVFLLLVLSQSMLLAAFNTLLRSALPEEFHGVSIGLGLPISDTAAVGLALCGALAGVVVTVVAVRALTRDRAALADLPASLATRRLGRAALSLLVSSLVVSVAVTLGSVLVVPGLFLAVSFLFVPYFVCLEDDRALTALRRSWGLASGNRWRLFGLVLVVAALIGFANAVVGALSLVDLTAAQAVSVAVTSAFNVVSVAAVGDAFRQLRGTEQL